MSHSFSKAELKRAAAKLREARLAALGPADTIIHDFSPQFEQAMDRLARKGRRKAVWNRAVSVAASFLLVLVICAGVTLAVSPQARAAVITWLREQYENSIIYRFWGGGATSEFPTYHIGWLPDDAELSYSIDEETFFAAVYRSSDGEELITFSYSPADKVSMMEIWGSTENSELLSINGMSGEFIPYEDRPGGDVMWIDESTQIVFYLSSILEKSTIISVAESVFLAN